MKKDLIRILLSLSILLVSGFSQLHAFTNAVEGPSFSKISYDNVNISSFLSFDQGNATIIDRAPDHNREILKIDATEIRKEERDEEKSNSLKKRLKTATLLGAITFAYVLFYFLGCGNNMRIFYRIDSYFSADRYLLIRVFRI